MQQFKRVVENEITEISRLATTTRGLLKETVHIPAPVQYRVVMRRIAELADRWTDHLEFHSRVSPTVLAFDPRLSPALHNLDCEGYEIQRQLKILATADWPRSAHAGLISVRPRILVILDSLLHHLRDERETILPLLRFWTPAKAVVATAVPNPIRVQLMESPLTT